MRPVRLVLVALALGSCTGPTEPNDPPGPGGVPRETTVQSGALTEGSIARGDSAEFRIYLNGQFNHRFTFQALEGDLADTLVLVARNAATGALLGELRSAAGSAAPVPERFFHNPAGHAITAHIVVRGAHATDRGTFAFSVSLPTSEAEHTADSVILGDTLTEEWFDGPGDADVWRLHATAGDEFLILVGFDEVSGTTPGAQAVLTFGSASQGLVGRELAIDTTNFERHAVVVAAPSTGEYRIGLRGEGGWSGRYKLRVTRRVRAPESRPAAIVIGDTIAESIDEMADIDEFTFQATIGTSLMLNLATGDTWPSGLYFTILDVETEQTLGLLQSPIATLDLAGPTAWTVPHTGTYRVRVQTGPLSDRRAPVTGPYRFELYRVNAAPEHVSATIALGATMYGEVIDRRGDVDEFTIAIDSGQLIVGNLISQMGATPGLVVASLRWPDGFGGMNSWAHESDANERDSTLYGVNGYLVAPSAPAGGAHRLTVYGDPSAGMQYGFRAYRVEPAPESLPVQVPVETWVEGESLEVTGDEDRFLVPLVQGRQYAIEMEAPSLAPDAITLLAQGFLSFYVSVEVRSGPTGMVNLFGESTGLHELRVFGSYFAPDHVGPYRFRIVEVDPAPETADSILAIGDTVTSEGLHEFGDVDDFFVTASNTDRLNTILDYDAAPGRSLFIYVTNAATGEMVCCSISPFRRDGFYEWIPPLVGTHTYRFSVRGNGGSRASVVDSYFLAVTRMP